MKFKVMIHVTSTFELLTQSSYYIMQLFLIKTLPIKMIILHAVWQLQS